MLSNSDKCLDMDTRENEVNNQSKDEILDYLTGLTNECQENCFESLRETIQENHKKLEGKSKQKQQLHAVNKPKKSTVNPLKRVITNNIRYFVNTIDSIKDLSKKIPHVPTTNPNKTRFSAYKPLNMLLNQDKIVSSVKTMKMGQDKFIHNLLIPMLKKIAVFIVYLLNELKPVSILIYQKAKIFINQKLPVYKSSTVQALIIIGCSIATLLTQVIVHNNTSKAINPRKLAHVNWNVNGQISSPEKLYIKELIEKGNIVVGPNASNYKNNVKLLSKTNLDAKKSVSPDSSFMILASNTFNHPVETGESVLSISKKYRVSISELISNNPNLDLISLKPGDLVIVPNNTETSELDPVRPSNFYSKIPRSLLASRALLRNGRFFPINQKQAKILAMIATRNAILYRQNVINNPRNNIITEPYSDGSSGIVGGSGGMMWPVLGSRTVSSPFGRRGRGFHPGIDITAPTGTPIIASRDGVVSSSGWSGGYGKCIVLDHGNGATTRYGHASTLLVNPGQYVKAGQIIGRIGSTGWSTGPHLHFEVSQNGSQTNPMKHF